MKYRLAQGRSVQLRLPLSPMKAEMARSALENWRPPADEGAEKRWYRIANSADGSPTRVNIFDEISWWGISAQEFVDELAGVSGAIEVHINSPGSMLMIHDALAMTIGNEADHLESARVLAKVSGNIADVYAAHTDTPAAEWRAAMQAEGWYTAQEAVDAGLAHKLAARAAAAPTEAPDAAFDRSIFNRWHGQLADKAMPVHHTATVDKPWDGPAAVKAMPNDDTVLKYCFAWQDSGAASTPHKEGDDDADDQKSNYKFPHHQHKGGPANLAGCRNGLARLSGADIPDGDRAGVKAHLQAHLDDATGADDHTDPGIGLGPEELLKALKEAFK